jgi:predicted ArsR family transcriptional regulator
VLAERLPPAQLDEALREAGRRLARGRPPATGDLRRRAEQAASLLNDLGGLAELEPHNGALTIRGYSCPLATAVADHPQACRLTESLLAEVIGAPVRERCDKGPQPRCRFEIG